MTFRERTDEMRPLAWSYIRLSTAEQIAEGRHGEVRQLDAAARYADEHHLDLQPTLRDLGVSAFKGKHRLKGDLGKFLRMVEDGLVPRGSYFLVENCDRLSREEPVTALETFTAIINAGITVVTTDDGQVYNRQILSREPMKLMMWIMQTIRGNSESARKAEMVTKAANARKAKSRELGQVISGRVPTWLRKKADGSGYEVDPEKGLIIERIFREFDAGLGSTKIAQRLNDDGVKPFNDYRKRETRGWHQSVVVGIAKSRKVLGEHQMTKLVGFGDEQQRVNDGEPIPNFYPAAITDEALWWRVQSRIRSRAETAPHGGGRKGSEFSNLFGGLAVCNECGGPMAFRGAYGVTKAVLQCGNAGRKHTCKSKRRFDYQHVEDTVLKFVAEIDLIAPEGRSEAEIELDLLIARRDSTAAKLSNLIDMIENGEGGADMAARVRERRAEIDQIEEQIGSIRLRVKEGQSARRPRDHQQAVQAITAQLAQASGEELYALRSRLAVSMQAVIDWIEFYGAPDEVTPGGSIAREDYFVVRMVGDERLYMISPESVTIEDGQGVKRVWLDNDLGRLNAETFGSWKVSG